MPNRTPRERPDPMLIANQLLNHYSLPRIAEVHSIGSGGGFSGAELWRVMTDEGEFCLRRWPDAHPGFDLLSWIHRVLLHAKIQNCPFVAAPIRTDQGETILRHSGSLWELSPWMPGEANFLKTPSEERLVNMMQSLARFHLASAQVTLDFHGSQSLKSRIDQLEDLPRVLKKIQSLERRSGCEGTESNLDQKLASLGWWVQEKAGKLRPLIENLKRFESQIFPVQPIIADVWHDHVLFTGNRVTGLVDFGAMQMDNVALDLARLLGSTLGEDRDRWSIAVDAYSSIRRLGESEIALLPWLDRCGVLLGSANWLKWIRLDNRQFEDWARVAVRIDRLLFRLEAME